ncbi:vitamin K epoxide reductase family protein [Rhizosphaericola mali]|uniref:Thioredoxin domain-containing protein n=1 Tax=Rhizosphaericola mali TaxID=2545455 RepID=A0A5P2G1Y4_9BACT|nr:vitamin K epoxide reductase family protein [Rhizosphaericola mali]QES88728.1 thioredoxin domain-containing protein [Rhizosphaericola mali]
MINLFRNLISTMYNCEESVYYLCQRLNIPITQTSLQKQLEEHPDYPSLLAVSDVLSNNGVENFAINTDTKMLKDFPLPFIVQIKINHENLFAVITNIVNNKITFFDTQKYKQTTLSYNQFKEIFTGYILLSEKGENSGEIDYHKKLKEEKRNVLTKLFIISTVPFLTILACTICFITNKLNAIVSIIYTLLALAGTSVGGLLLWYEVDKHNPTLQQICTGSSKTNCNAILNSDASKIFGISWSVIGFTYFAGSLISMLVSGIYNIPVLFLLAWLNVLALPYIAFSLYYQKKIAKQWCVLCLTVQAILALQFTVSLCGNFLSVDGLHTIESINILSIMISFAIPFLIVSLLLPALRQAKENKQNKNELQRLKHNPQIFEALLAKQKPIIESTHELGILLGNPNATHKLIKVCNPYCSPCANAHSTIEDLLENNPDLQVQIIYTATDDEKDIKSPPVKHLLAIASSSNSQTIKKALDDWYLVEKKDYAVFAAKYPMNGELKLQANKVKAMRDWCNKTGITFTPTFFVNGYQLPQQYTVADLKYFLSV